MTLRVEGSCTLETKFEAKLLLNAFKPSLDVRVYKPNNKIVFLQMVYAIEIGFKSCLSWCCSLRKRARFLCFKYAHTHTQYLSLSLSLPSLISFLSKFFQLYAFKAWVVLSTLLRVHTYGILFILVQKCW